MISAAQKQEARRRYKVMTSVLDERSRRRFVALEARAMGRGGVSTMAKITGIARRTIYHGLSDIDQKNAVESAQPVILTTTAGDSVFMRKKLEAIKKELGATGKVPDRDAYRALMNVRAKVNERYGEAIHWLRQQGREEEARRFELMQRNLPPVRSEKQLVADALVAEQQLRKGRDSDLGREL